jgi:hypothetical protein
LRAGDGGDWASDHDELGLALRWACETTLESSGESRGRRAVASVDGVELPRLPVKALHTADGHRSLLELLRRHTYVILTDVGEGVALWQQVERDLQRFFLETRVEDKPRFTGDVYVNERGVPMWHCGYELAEDLVRECFRVHVQAESSSLLASSPPLHWPTASFRRHWAALRLFCQAVCDQALSVALGSASADDARRLGSDFSVSYALHYPNREGGARTVPVDVAGATNINVKVPPRRAHTLLLE